MAPAEVACDGAAVPSLAHTMMGAPYEAPLASTEADFALHVPASDIDKKDADTPDAWVPRDPRIQRLTGRHPLNCEPPMDVLMAAGFITPPSLHYVRNHGPAPRINWGSHRVTIGGAGVRTPLSLTMDEIVAMPSVRIPITLVCAGNRRKEENMIKKSIGFNWGPCAVATTYWTGVRLRDLLLAAGVKVGDGCVCGGGLGACRRTHAHTHRPDWWWPIRTACLVCADTRGGREPRVVPRAKGRAAQGV
jgi:DMSO/TMAO reductase YedYZ molybdopterin-dependent catalytic subunit